MGRLESLSTTRAELNNYLELLEDRHSDLGLRNFDESDVYAGLLHIYRAVEALYQAVAEDDADPPYRSAEPFIVV